MLFAFSAFEFSFFAPFFSFAVRAFALIAREFFLLRARRLPPFARFRGGLRARGSAWCGHFFAARRADAAFADPPFPPQAPGPTPAFQRVEPTYLRLAPRSAVGKQPQFALPRFVFEVSQLHDLRLRRAHIRPRW